MPTQTLPPPAPRATVIPPSPSGRQQLRRRFNLPDNSSCTLTLSVSDTPSSYRYRITHHEPGTRHGRTIFAGLWPVGVDPEDTAADLLRAVVVRPGMPGDELVSSFTPDQLAWVLHYAEPVRALMTARLGWSDPEAETLSAGLEVVAEVRATLRASTRYRYSLGILSVSGRTKRETRAALAAAVGAQCSTAPAVRVGPRSRDVYIMYPLGLEYVLQLVHPAAAEPVGLAQRYSATSLAEALAVLDATVEHREQLAPPAPPKSTVPPRVSSRAPKRRTVSVRPVVS